MTTYRTAPTASSTLPSGIPYIIGNEAAERFSFYGLNAILVIFMTQYIIGANGALDVMSDDEAKSWFHLFVATVYFTPFIGAILSDGILGKYRTIILLSLVYCVGHIALAIDHTRMGLVIGLSLIALGSGGIKPCVSAHVGDQFAQNNSHLISKVFAWFYFAINFGAFISILLTPWLLNKYNASIAFAIPGVLMGLATLVFWFGRHRFVHIPPAGMGFVREVFSGESLTILARLSIIYLFIMMFWALFAQTVSAWVIQAMAMDRVIFGVEVLPAQINAANPILIMVLIPIFSYIIYPWLNKYWQLTPLRKISLGLFITVLAFLISTVIQYAIDSGQTPHISWQLLAFLIITSAEVMVSITCLEFSYTQAPTKMKSFVMALFLLSISLGNLFTSAVNYIIQNDDGSSKLEGASYYLFFTILMLITAIAFTQVARLYQGQTYLQSADNK
ncbi:Di-tripeptide/cation symporter [hydrothermal vent metagenome]|uniref:Di-tripeptide/cation symporter n=1 Tax=hydrothermal vent metagenome TaxID=652676 RepID=A0A3B1AWA5_9ZZZZ